MKARRSRILKRVGPALGALVLLLWPAASAGASAQPGEIDHFPLPVGSEPQGIAVGPDGNLWFANRGLSSVGRITPTGELREFPVPGAEPFQVAAGPDGNIWFTELGGNRIGRITPEGRIAEFPVPPGGCCRTWGITAGPDGNIWFTLADMFGGVGRATPDGRITVFQLGAEGRGITVGPDGNLWVAAVGYEREEPTIGDIARVTPQGSITNFLMPPPHAGLRPSSITTGPDGNLWFAGDGIGRIGVDGKIRVFEAAVPGELDGIATGPDGNIWFGSAGPAPLDGAIGRITTRGLVSTFGVPYGSRGVAAGPDGSIWFTEWAGHAIGSIVPGLAGLGVASSRATVVRGRTRIRISCSGGAPGSRCRGRFALVKHFRPRRPEGGRGPRVTRHYGSALYDLASGSRGSVILRLSRRARAILRSEGSFAAEAVAWASAGEGLNLRFALFPA